MSDFLFARGSRAAEAKLVAAVQEEAAAARAETALLASPVLVVVPSRELRDHLAIRLAHAGATLGVEVLSLHALALRLHRAAGKQPESHSAQVEVLARRAAKDQPALCARLDDLQDGMGLAASSIRDLLSARVGVSDMPIVAAAHATAAGMREAGVARPGDLQEAASEWVSSHLDARSVLIHGFADATGQAICLLRALLAHGARIVIDLPSDPSQPELLDRGQEFVAEFVQRLGGALPEVETELPPPPIWSQSHAAGIEDEVREAAQQVHRWLAEGVPSEEIGIVARNLTPYAASVRRWFRELGVPFRGGGAAPASLYPTHRRMQAALAVLRAGEDCPVDRWLDAVVESSRGGAIDPQRIADFRLAFRALGLGRLGQVARFDAAAVLGGQKSFILPVRRGLLATVGVNEEESSDTSDGSGELAVTQPPLVFEEQYRSHSRSIPAGSFIQVFGAAHGLMRALHDWPARAGLSEHAARAGKIFKSEFGWRTDDFDKEDNWHDLVHGLGEVDLGTCMRGEYLLMLEREAQKFGARALGGASGVAVLDLTQARARTFQRVLVLGLNRGVFPRVVQSDPILNDRARAALRSQGIADDLQLAERGHAEERYLFAQLCSSAEQVHLSWLRADEEGKEQPASPFLQRLWLSPHCPLEEKEASAVPRLRSDLLAREGQLCTGAEWLTLAGLLGDRMAWRALLPAVLPGAPVVAASRASILDEYEPDLSSKEGRQRAAEFGPWSGMLPEGLPDASALFVTRLERFAACGWRSFLEQSLRLESAPDPLADLPDIDAALLGRAVHRALETLLVGPEEARGKSRKVGRPVGSEVKEHLIEAARAEARTVYLHSPGLIQALADRAEFFVLRALDIEFASRDVLHVQGCEVRGELDLKLPDGSIRQLSFLADREDRGSDGDSIYTDYKTSRPPWKQKKVEDRAKKLAESVLRGERLQVAAYAASSEGATGRYLFLRPRAGVADAAYQVELAQCARTVEAFRNVGGELMAAREAGLAFARMEKPDGSRPMACDWCEVSEACLRHDSGARRRLVQSLDKSDGLVFDLWSMPERKWEGEV
ncbi:MAG: PD-(D/E)XK nuclease family protein [Planctomycetes bacterium]|nr:PD-(D/E)XK nuclease family protein [Planctomycetota bacterium]